MKDLYVDNLITGTNSKGADFQIYEQEKQIFKRMGFEFLNFKKFIQER